MGRLTLCDMCGQRGSEHSIGVYWRWSRADGEWKKYYGKLCDACYAAKVAPLEVALDTPGVFSCPGCRSNTEADMAPIYITAFVGGRGKIQADAPFCAPCAANYQRWVIDGARDVSSFSGSTETQRVASHTPITSKETIEGFGRPLRVR